MKATEKAWFAMGLAFFLAGCGKPCGPGEMEVVTGYTPSVVSVNGQSSVLPRTTCVPNFQNNFPVPPAIAVPPNLVKPVKP